MKKIFNGFIFFIEKPRPLWSSIMLWFSPIPIVLICSLLLTYFWVLSLGEPREPTKLVNTSTCGHYRLEIYRSAGGLDGKVNIDGIANLINATQNKLVSSGWIINSAEVKIEWLQGCSVRVYNAGTYLELRTNGTSKPVELK